MKIESIKILGRNGCKNCSNMFEAAINIAQENNIVADIQHITDLEQIANYGVMSLPGLVVNEKVLSYGKILNKEQIQKLLEL